VDKPAVVHTRWLGMLKPSPENDALYRPVSMDDPEVIRLAESIKQRGLLEPIIITEDNYILSGHRRRVACMLAGVKEVPVRVHSIRHNDPEFLPLLRECNRQRTKSFDEILRETKSRTSPSFRKPCGLAMKKAASESPTRRHRFWKRSSKCSRIEKTSYLSLTGHSTTRC
jgi:hypothetical protein